MAALSQTITNTLRVFAGGPTTKWNQFVWAAAVWGEGTLGMMTTATKLLGNGLTLDAQQFHTLARVFSGTITFTAEPQIIMFDGSNWAYVWPSATTEFEDRTVTEWDEVTVDSP